MASRLVLSVALTDRLTAVFILTKLLSLVFFILFPFLTVGFNIINLISAFSKKAINIILLLIWTVVNLVCFLLIPAQSTVVATYQIYHLIVNTVWILSPKNMFLVSSLILIGLFILKLKVKYKKK